MATTYTAVSNKGFVVNVKLNPSPTGANQTIAVSYACHFVYPYAYDDYSTSFTLAYSINGGNWTVINNGSSITMPSYAQTLRIRLGYSLEITEERTTSYQTWTQKPVFNDDPTTPGKIECTWVDTQRTVTETERITLLYTNNTWYSESISLNNNPSISGSDTDLGEKSTAFSIEYSVNDTDTSDAITVECYYDDILVSTVENAVRNQKYQFMISNAMLAPSAINSSHTIKIIASDGKGTTTRTYTFIKNRNPEPYMDYTINPVQTDGMPTTIVIGQLAGQDQKFQTNVYVCNNAFDEQPMWEDMSGQYHQGLSYNFVNTVKTADKWGISVRFVNSKYNSDDQIDIAGCGFWCDKMIVVG